MELFLDSADLAEVKTLAATGMVDGLTTNPSLIAKAGGDFFALLGELAKAVQGPISAEVVEVESPRMAEQGRKLAGVADNIVVKLPLTWEGLKACQILRREAIPVNLTLCFSLTQALLGANAGATYISPFIGRLEDKGLDGMALIHDMVEAYSNYPAISTKILAASIRSPDHVRAAMLSGADCATLPPGIFRRLLDHPLTEQGLADFLSDWKKTGQTF